MKKNKQEPERKTPSAFHRSEEMDFTPAPLHFSLNAQEPAAASTTQNLPAANPKPPAKEERHIRRASLPPPSSQSYQPQPYQPQPLRPHQLPKDEDCDKAAAKLSSAGYPFFSPSGKRRRDSAPSPHLSPLPYAPLPPSQPPQSNPQTPK